MGENKARRFMWSLGYVGSFAVSCEGLSGGLALFWSTSYSVTLRGYNSHYIDVLVSEEKQDLWRVILCMVNLEG